jgi:uncharacterized RDD family membrane protein YckC
MQKAEPPGRPRGLPPADFRRRALARAMDMGVALLPIFLAPRGHPHAGEVLFAALLLYGDSLFGPGRSLGKRVLGLRVVKLATHRAAGMRDSVLRNLPFALAVIPAVFGASRPIFALALCCILAVEALVTLRPLTRDLGQRRLGDLLAGTQVIDTRVALGLDTNPAVKPARVSAPLASRAARRKDPAACALR